MTEHRDRYGNIIAPENYNPSTPLDACATTTTYAPLFPRVRFASTNDYCLIDARAGTVKKLRPKRKPRKAGR